MRLYQSIFHIPPSVIPDLSSPPTSPHTALAAASILHMILSSHSPLPPLHSQLLSSISLPGTRARLYLACALYPYRLATYQDQKGKIHPAVEAAIRECLKLGQQNHYLDGIPALFAATEVLKAPQVDSAGPSPKERLRIGRHDSQIYAKTADLGCSGLLLREKCVHNPHTGSHWASSVLFSLVSELVPLWDPVEDKFNGG